MFDISAILLFLGSSVLITLAPGPDILFTITQGLSNGKTAGFTTALGLASGNLVHTLAAALGLSVLFKTSPIAYLVLKIAGAAYLLYLAYMSIKYRNESLEFKNNVKAEKNLFWRGFIMNILNPKVALFFIAFLPLFVNHEHGQVMLQFAILGVIFAAQVVVVFGSAGWFAGYFGSLLKQHKGFSKTMNIVSAIVFAGIAASLFLI